MDLNKFAQEIHQNAISHGWWPDDRTDAEVLSLIHSEWSEALESYRNSEPMVWMSCDAEDGHNACERSECGNWRYEETYDEDFNDITDPDADGYCNGDKQRPEGIAVELIDGVIRLLDAAAAWHITIPEDIYWTLENVKGIIMKMPLPNLVMLLHHDTSKLWDDSHDFHTDPKLHTYDFSDIIGTVWIWLKARNQDPEAIMQAKHSYNLTRPYKHGGKKI